MRQSERMSSEYNLALIKWVQAHMQKRRMSKIALARYLGFEKSDKVSKALKSVREFRSEEVKKMEELFSERFRFAGNTHERNGNLSNSLDLLNKPLKIAELGETISAVLWGEKLKKSALAIEIAGNPFDRWAGKRQEAWLMKDNSGEPFAPKGAFVIVVDYEQSRDHLTENDMVIIKKYHPLHFSRGDLIKYENLIMVVGKDEHGFVFRPIDPASSLKEISYNSNDKSIVIERLVIGCANYIE